MSLIPRFYKVLQNGNPVNCIGAEFQPFRFDDTAEVDNVIREELAFFMYSAALSSFDDVSTCLKWSMCSSADLENTTISSS